MRRGGGVTQNYRMTPPTCRGVNPRLCTPPCPPNPGARTRRLCGRLSVSTSQLYGTYTSDSPLPIDWEARGTSSIRPSGNFAASGRHCDASRGRRAQKAEAAMGVGREKCKCV